MTSKSILTRTRVGKKIKGTNSISNKTDKTTAEKFPFVKGLQTKWIIFLSRALMSPWFISKLPLLLVLTRWMLYITFANFTRL